MAITDLKDACIEIAEEIRTISGIRNAPDVPPESNDLFPFLLTAPGAGVYQQGPAQVMTALNNIEVELHIKRMADLSRSFSTAWEYVDQIPYELMKLLNDGGFSTIKTFGYIERSRFVAMEYGGVKTVGYLLTITDVKTQTSLV